jgi:hypothetical protein
MFSCAKNVVRAKNLIEFDKKNFLNFVLLFLEKFKCNMFLIDDKTGGATRGAIFFAREFVLNRFHDCCTSALQESMSKHSESCLM